MFSHFYPKAEDLQLDSDYTFLCMYKHVTHISLTLC